MAHDERKVDDAVLALLAAVALAALASACGRSRTSDCEQMWNYWRPRVISAAATNRPMPIVPGESVGPVALGMTAAEVARALGPPQRAAFGGWEYPTLGMAVSFENGRVVSVSAGGGSCGDPERLLSKAFAGRFAERVGMGATKQEVIAVLGEPLGPGFRKDNLEMLTYHNMDLAFEDDRWSWLRISLPAR